MATARTLLQRERMKRAAIAFAREQILHSDILEMSKADRQLEADTAIAAYTGVVTRCNVIHKKPVVRMVVYRGDKCCGFKPGKRDYKIKPLIFG